RLPAAQVAERVAHYGLDAMRDQRRDTALGGREPGRPEGLEETVEAQGEKRLLRLVAEDQVDQHRHGMTEAWFVGSLEPGGHARFGPRGRRHEEPRDGQLEGACEGDDLIGGEVADEAPGDRTLGLGERRLRPPN